MENCDIIELMQSDDKKVVYVFIDASNLWQAQKVKGKLFDFEKLKRFIKHQFGASDLLVFYYTAYPAEGTREYSQDGKHKFFTYLSKGLGFTVRKKEIKQITIHSEIGDSILEKGNMDVEMTIDAVHNLLKYNTAVFFTGDSDFLALISYIKNRGKSVYIYSSENNISQELRTGGSGYCDVLEIKEDIWREDLHHRKEK